MKSTTWQVRGFRSRLEKTIEYCTKQRVKINDKYSSFEEILFGVAQGSILGPLLCSIFISDLFLILNNIEIASYADDNTPYCSYKNLGDVITCLERTAGDLFAWFNNNGIKANTDKCHLLLSTKVKLKVNIKLCNCEQ